MLAVPASPTRPNSLFDSPNYGEFEITASNDFLLVEVQFETAIHPGKLTKRSSVSRTEALDDLPGGYTNRALLHIDDVKSWDDLQLQLHELEKSNPFTCEPKITCMETSLDARHRWGDAHEHRWMVERFFRLSMNHCSDNARLMRNRGETETAYQHRMGWRLENSFTIFLGNRDDDTIQRLYHKQTTRRGGEIVQLDPREHCARFEVRLSGDSLPFCTIEQARAFRFESLSSHFRLRQVRAHLRTELPGAALCALEATPSVGKRAPRGRRLYDKRTEADSAFTEIVYARFKSLTKRMNKADPRLKRYRLHTNSGAQSYVTP